MKRAIREHLRDFVAITVLLLAGLLVTGVILSQQQQPYPSWVPILGDDRFELEAELSTAQAVTPGQGQTVNIAGVEVGDISDVRLEGGHAVVTMLVERKYQPLLRSDSTVLLRPRTGLQDMTMDIDPGTSGEPLEDGSTIPLSQTEPNVQPDQILASLDGDTRAYLKLLIQGGAQGLGGRGVALSSTLRRFEPLGRHLARIGDALVARRQSISRVITSFSELGDELGRADVRVADWVESSNQALGAFADSEAEIRSTLRELPPALAETRIALRSGDRLALELGPASEALIPAARALPAAERAARGFFTQTVDPIRDQIRPFSRQVAPPVRHLRQAAAPLAETTTGLGRSFADLNRLFNALAYNPPGGEEGYLFWLAWLNHNTNNVFLTQDANGPLRRGLVLQSCQTATLAEALAEDRRFLRTLQQVTNVPPADEICPLDPTFVPPIAP